LLDMLQLLVLLVEMLTYLVSKLLPFIISYSGTFLIVKILILFNKVTCIPVPRQRQRNKQLYNSRC
jgi:hypothetical protein